MASKTAILAIKIIGEAQDAIRALKQTETAVKNTEKTTKKSGKAMAGVWTAVAAAMVQCVRAAGALEQSTNAVSVVFGEQADEMMDWAEGMAVYGLTTAQAAQSAAAAHLSSVRNPRDTPRLSPAAASTLTPYRMHACAHCGSRCDATSPLPEPPR